MKDASVYECKMPKLKLKNSLTSKTNRIFLVIFFIALFFRVYKPAELFLYSHDQDLAGWFIRDVLENGHLRLIGQETSTQGIFIGPLYYYLLIPFYLLFGMDPIGGVALITILGMFSVWSIYFVFSRVFGQKEGLIASFFYTISFYTIFNDREVVPTMPVLVWTIWYFYALNLIMKGKQKKGFFVAGILIGLIWHFNVALILLAVLILLTALLSKKRLKIKSVLLGVLGSLGGLSPLMLFEIRHNFSQSRWLWISLTTNQQAVVSGFERVQRMFHLMSKNLHGFIWGNFSPAPYEFTTWLLLIVGALLIYKRVIKKNLAIILFSWICLYMVFFSIYSKVLSEYYLNGSLLPFIVILTLGTSFLLSKKKTLSLGVIVIALFTLFNLQKYFSLSVNKSGYKYKRAIVEEIKRDAEKLNYPCVSVSYITDPGYELGYRYFFYLEDMHVNNPDSLSPVYTVVFPLKPIFEVDKTFGAIGLIYPDYSRYTYEEVEKSCQGENSNLTDPLFGFTN